MSSTIPNFEYRAEHNAISQPSILYAPFFLDDHVRWKNHIRKSSIRILNDVVQWQRFVSLNTTTRKAHSQNYALRQGRSFCLHETLELGPRQDVRRSTGGRADRI